MLPSAADATTVEGREAGAVVHLACFALAFQSGADYDSVPIPYFHREVIVLRLISEIFQYVQAQGDLRQGEVRRGRLLSSSGVRRTPLVLHPHAAHTTAHSDATNT